MFCPDLRDRLNSAWCVLETVDGIQDVQTHCKVDVSICVSHTGRQVSACISTVTWHSPLHWRTPRAASKHQHLIGRRSEAHAAKAEADQAPTVLIFFLLSIPALLNNVGILHSQHHCLRTPFSISSSAHHSQSRHNDNGPSIRLHTAGWRRRRG